MELQVSTQMKKCILATAVFVGVSWFLQSPSIAQTNPSDYETDLRVERAKLEAHIKLLRAVIANSNDSHFKNIDRQVRFQISDLNVPNAMVGRNQQTGITTVYMTAEYRLLATYLADVDLIVTLNNDFNVCRDNYVDAVVRVLATNRQISASGGIARRIPAPEVFLDAAAPNCQPFKKRFPIEIKYRQKRDQTADVVIGLGYLHELGHFALGHSPVNLSSIEQLPTNSLRLDEFVRLMARSRTQESQADDWAIDRLVDLSPDPVLSLTNVLLTFYMSYSGLDCSLEQADSHPNGYQRFVRQMKRMKDRATAAGKFTNQEAAAVIDDLSVHAIKAKEELKCPR
jgi:hypothetical protein